MSNNRLLASLRNDADSADAELLAARTDCIELSDRDEETVTATLKALQHLVKRNSITKEECDAAESPGTELMGASSVTEYLKHFSYGLSPGESRYVVFRFLRTNNMNIPKALEDLKRTAEFRKKQNLDKMALFPCLISICGYDQPAMCEELGIPFIHNLTSGKRYVDAEGRLRLEQDQLDYYNVQYDDIYSNLAASTGRPATNSPLSSRAGHGVTSAAHGNGGNNGDSSRRCSTYSAQSGDGKAHKKGPGGIDKSNDANNSSSGFSWRSLIPFHMFGHGKEKEKSSPPLSRSGTVAFSSKNTDGRRMSHAHSVLSFNENNRNSSLSGRDDIADDDITASQQAVLLNPSATGEALTGNPYTIFSDSMNFHGILRPIIAVITKHVPFAFHYWDREGHPIMYCRLGGLDSKRLIRDLFALTPIDAEPRALAVLFNTYALAVLWQLIRYCNRKNRKSNLIHDVLLEQVQRSDHRGSSATSTQATGLFRKKPSVGSCLVVVDCAGLQLRRYLYKPLLVMVKSIVSMNVQHYPELLHHVYVTNCGSAMSFSYLMIRGLLHEETRQKVTFCGRHNSTSTLLENISSDLLPQELGGRCRCLGGCIPSVAATMLSTESNAACGPYGDAQSSTHLRQSEFSSLEQTGDYLDDGELFVQHLHRTVARLNLRPHTSKTLNFAMNAHAEIVWEFVVKNERKVTFSAVFVSATDDGAMLSLVPRQRTQSDAGHYICPSLGTIIFRWSNKCSCFHRCRVNLKIYSEDESATYTQDD